MADENGKLTPEDRQKFVSWLAVKKAKPTCPVCSANNWSMGEDVLHSPVFSESPLNPSASYPMVFMACANCYYVRHFMAMPIGIKIGEEDAPADEGEQRNG